MNPILEEEESGSDSPRMETSENFLQFIRPQQQASNFSGFDEAFSPTSASDETSMQSETVPRSSPLSKWMDFKPPQQRSSEASTSSEAFPMLVRGLEIESGLIRKNSLTKDTAPVKRTEYDESPNRSRNDVSTFSLSAAEFLKFDKQKSFESAEEEETKQEDGFAQQVAKAGPTIVDRILEKQREGTLSAEELLLMAISEQETPVSGRRGSIWGKLGRKSRPEDIFKAAVEEWTRINMNTKEVNQQKIKTQKDIEDLKRMKSEQTETNAELTDTINTISSRIKEVRKNRKAACDTLAKETETQTTLNGHLLEELQVTSRDTGEQLCAAMEMEERWESRIEELRQVLLCVEEDRQIAEAELQEYRGLLGELTEGNWEYQYKQQETETCLSLLSDAMDYFSQSQDHIHFNEVFCKLLTGLKEATLETIAAERMFEETAERDPREMLPYKRASDHVTGMF